MEAPSITQTTDTIIGRVAQPLSEKIKEVEFQIQDFLVHGAIQATTEIIRKLAIWFEDLIWKSYLTSLLQCEIIMSWLRALGAQKGFRGWHRQELPVAEGQEVMIKRGDSYTR